MNLLCDAREKVSGMEHHSPFLSPGLMSCKHPDHLRRRRNLRMRPYGQSRGLFWCWGCDAALVPPPPNKKRARRQAREKLWALAREI